ncbi:MAG TPA: CinA family protein, partial [Acidimicrobiales bacterium]
FPTPDGANRDVNATGVIGVVFARSAELLSDSPTVLATEGRSAMWADQLEGPARRVATLLRDRGETVGVAEGACGGLVSAALLSVPGASAYFVGGAVIYTFRAKQGFLGEVIETPPDLRGATEAFAAYLAAAVRARLGTTWGVGEGGAAGPPNRYGDPAGHAWLAVDGPVSATRHVLTGSDDRAGNMERFAVAALELLGEALGPTS